MGGEHDAVTLVAGGERVYIWTPEGASFVQIPLPDFDALTVRQGRPFHL